MSRGVDDVDLGVAIHHGRIFGQNGNAPLPFQVVAVENGGLGHLGLVVPKGVGLFKHGVHERCFAVVDVRDDSDVSDLHRYLEGSMWQFAC